MSVTLGIAIFFVVWWVVLFAVLPFFTHTQEEAGEVVPGTPESAPAAFAPLRIVFATTVVTGIVFACIWALFRWRVIDIDAMLSRGLGG